MVELSRVWDGTAVGDATDAPYDAATKFSAILMSIAGAAGVATYLSGVFRNELNQLAVTGSATPVSIATGRALTWGAWYENNTITQIAIPTPAGSTRVDRIVLRKSWADQTVRLTRIAGTEGAGAPALTTSAGTTWDQPIAQVSITTGGVISITDERAFIGGSTFSNLSTFATGDILYAANATTLARLPAGATNSILTITAGIPAWTLTPTLTSLTTTGGIDSAGAIRITANNVGFQVRETGGTYRIGVRINGSNVIELGDGSNNLSLMSTTTFFTSGAILSFNAGDVQINHTPNTLSFTGASSGYLFDAAVIIAAGGLRVSAGNVGVGAAPMASVGVNVTGSLTAGGSQFGFATDVTFSSTGTTAGYGLYSMIRTAAVAFNVANARNFYAAVPSLGLNSTVSNIFGLDIANQGNAQVTNAYGINIAAQVGATAINIGLYNGGTTTLVGAVTVSAGVTITDAAAAPLRLIRTGAQASDHTFITGAQGVAGRIGLQSNTLGTYAWVVDAANKMNMLFSASVTGTFEVSGATILTSTTTITNGVLEAGAAANLFLRSNFGVYIEIDRDNNATTEVFAIRTNSGATNLFSVSENGLTVVGAATTNTKMTIGLTIDQAGNDDDILTFKSAGDISHGMTTPTEANTYASFGKLGGATGGLYLRGYSSSNYGVYIAGNIVTEDANKTTGAAAAIVLAGYTRNGAGPGLGNMGAAANVLAVQNNGLNLAIFDGDGDLHLNQATAINVWDDYDDIEMARALRVSLLPEADPLRMRFSNLIDQYRIPLSTTRLVTFNEDGNHYLNMKRLAMFSLDAIYQLGERLNEATKKISNLEAQLALGDV